MPPNANHLPGADSPPRGAPIRIHVQREAQESPHPLQLALQTSSDGVTWEDQPDVVLCVV